MAATDEALRARDAFILDLEQSILTPVAPVYLQLRRIVQHATERPEVVQDPAWLLPRLSDLSERFEAYLRRLDHVCDLALAISGGQPLAAERIDLAATVRRAAGRFERELAAAQVDLTIEAGSAPVMGRWERSRLEGLCSHLLSNSIKFGAGAPVAVSVRGEAAHAHVTVAVRRHAMTEMETDPDLVFEELRKRETAAGSLSGGLWAVRHLATAMGGTVAVRCEDGLGSACTVTLPRHDS